MKKIGMIVLVFLMMCGCAQAPVQNQEDVPLTQIQLDFEEFLDEEYAETVASDALSLHFSLRDPEAFGIEAPDLTLGEVDDESILEGEEEIREVMKELESYDPEQLTKRQKDDWNMLHEYLEIQLLFEGLSYYQNLFSPAQSVTDALITNFTEYKFYDEEDVQEYLILLQDVPRYLKECMAFTQKQSALGLFMSDFSVDKTIAEIDKFLSKEGDNALIVSFENKLQDASFATEAYKNENRSIVEEQVLPAYHQIKDELKQLKNTAQFETLADTEEGKRYYEALFAYKTGSSLTPDKMLEKGKEVLLEVLQEYMQLMYMDETLASRYMSVSFEDKAPEEILKMYQKELVNHFPKGPDVTYTAEYLDPSITNEATIAYYLIPPYDYITDNIIKINPLATQGDSLTLYSTLAHEGFPGHCFQTTYYYDTNPHPIRTIVENLGYTEGYAMAVELYSFEWMLKDDPNLARFLALDTELNYLLQALVDIGVNYEGWGKSGIRSFLREFGFVDSDDMVNSLYEYVVSDPGLLLPYGIGLLEMNELRKDTEERLGKRFNEIEYHRVILEAGPMYFDLLREKVDEITG